MIEKVVLNGEEHSLSPEYKDIRNKPSINGVELKEGNNAIDLVSINIDPNVDITGEGETPTVINTGTPKNPTLKFKLPKGEQGDTGKTYVPSVSEAGDLSWSLEDAPKEEESSTNIRGPQGERGKGLDADYSKSGKTTTVNITTDEPTPELLTSFQILDGNDGHNPCLGRFPSKPNPMPTGQVGDYIYVDTVQGETTTTEIYHYSSNGWDENGTEVDISNEEFNSGEKVHSVSIDGSGLVHPIPNALTKAEDVMKLNGALQGVTFKEEKVTTIEDWYPEGSSNGYYKSDKSWSTSPTVHSTRIDIHGKTAVRFKSFANNTTAACYALTDEQGVVLAVYQYKDPSIVNGTVLVDSKLDLSDIEDAYYFVCVYISGGSLTSSNFYCYLQSGNTVSQEMAQIKQDTKALGDEVFGYDGYAYNDKITGYTEVNRQIIANNTWYDSGYGSKFVQITPNSKIKLINTGSHGGYYAILKNVEGHDVNGTSVNFATNCEKTVLNSGSSKEINIPVDGNYLYIVKGNSSGTVSIDAYIGEFTHIQGLNDKVVDIVDNLDTNDSRKALSAKQGKILSNMLGDGFGVVSTPTAPLTPYKPVDDKNGYYKVDTNTWYTPFNQTTSPKSTRVAVGDNDFVQFLGLVKAGGNSILGYAFEDENGNLLGNVLPIDYVDASEEHPSGQYFTKQYVWNIPNGAYYFVFILNYNDILTDSNTYCNLLKGESVSIVINKLKKEVEDDYVDMTGITHLKPDNQGQLNAVKRMRKLTDVEYTPAFDFSRLSTGGGASSYLDIFLEGVTYKGIPYSRSYRKMTEYGYKASSSDYTGFKIGFYISLDTFITALSNHGTVMELESIFDHSTSGHNSSFYSNICAGCASAALGVGYISTESFWNIPSGFTSIGLVSDVFDLTLLKLGDVMAKTGVHTVMVTDVIKNSGGVITHVEVSEGTTAGNDNYHKIGGKLGGVARRLWWTANGFKKKWDGYKVIRYNNIANVPYIPNPYVPMPDEQYGGDAEYGSTPYYMAVLPYMGNKFRYVVSAAQLNDILKLVITVNGRTYQSGGSTVTIDAKTHAVIERYDEDNDTWEEVGEESINYSEWNDTTHPYVYVELSDEKYKVVGQYRAFAYVTRTYENGEYVYTSSDAQSSGKTRVCEWSVVENISLLTDF